MGEQGKARGHALDKGDQKKSGSPGWTRDNTGSQVATDFTKGSRVRHMATGWTRTIRCRVKQAVTGRTWGTGECRWPWLDKGSSGKPEAMGWMKGNRQKHAVTGCTRGCR